MISIHASEKEATQVARSERMVLQFQSTPPRRRRQLAGIDDEPQFKHFNPRLREGGDDTLEEAREVLGFQSTPPRRRRPWCHAFVSWCANISIHASEKEATFIISSSSSRGKISIHASEKEATATYCDTSTIMYISSLNNFFVHYFQLYIAIYCTIFPFLSANGLHFLRSL